MYSESISAIYELAGAVGVNPEPYTFREIIWMYRGKGKDEWSRLSVVLATTANMNSSKGKRFTSSDFNPYEHSDTAENVPGSIEDLKVFLDKDKK